MKCAVCHHKGPPSNEAKETPLLVDDATAAKFAVLAELCIEVGRTLGKGYVEGVYQQALCTELQGKGIHFVSEETMPIMYKGMPLGGGMNHRLDVALRSYLPFIFELKAIATIKSDHSWQLVRYMSYKDQPYGAVVNFSQSEKGALEIQFIVNQGGVFYLYNPSTRGGQQLVDYRFEFPAAAADED